MLCNRNKDFKQTTKNKNKETTEIEVQSKLILTQYASILNSSSVAFDREVTII